MPSQYEYAVAFASSGPRSQEACHVLERDGGMVVAVADGGGGMRSGSAASRSFVEVITSAVADREFPVDDTGAWLGLFQAMDMSLAAKWAGETTGVVVVLGRERLVGISTGNSGAWTVSRGAIDDLTAGQYTRQRLGSSHATPTVFERPVPKGVLLVASDGLFKFASIGVIAEVVRSHPLDRAADKLVDLVRMRSGKVAEDVVVVLVSSAAATANRRSDPGAMRAECLS